MKTLNKPAGIIRRLSACVYDIVILFALWIAATFLLMPLTQVQAITPGNRFYQCYLIAIAALYYIGSWHAFQQTIGMRAWGLVLMDTQHQQPSLLVLILRFLTAIFAFGFGGCGLWWMLLDKQKRALHDVISKTSIVIVRDATTSHPAS